MSSPDKPPPANTLYIIDGHAQIFRAYFAIRGGMNSPVTGESTHAVFGYAGMLIKLFDLFSPTFVVTAIDMPGKTFRDEIFPDYKATREAPPDDLEPQVQRILEMTRLFGIPIFGVEGAEADDVIATITQRVLDDEKLKDVQVRIVSRDKDLEQLLGPRVTMFDIHKDEVIDEAHLKKKKELTPAQVIDALALTGDKVDNIPGVEGVGPKTAAKLLDEFGSIDGIYENIEKIKGKRRENLEAAREKMPLSRQLVTLKRDVELDFDMDKARVGAIDANGLRHFFKEMGFRRHSADMERLLRGRGTRAAGQADEPKQGTFAQSAGDDGGPDSDGDDGAQGSLFPTSLFDAGEGAGEAGDEVPADMQSAADCDYRAITTREQLDELVKTLGEQKIIAVDTETIGLGHTAELCGVCLAWKEKAGVYVPVKSPKSEEHLDVETVLAALRPLLEDPDVPKCGHNVKYDALVLRHAGVNLQGIVFDSMIATHMVGTPSHGLDYLAAKLLKHKMIPISRLIGSRKSGARQKTMDRVPLADITPYAAEDADVTLRLYHQLTPKLKIMGMEKLARDVEMPLIEVLAEMEFHGIRVDPDELDRQRDELSSRIKELRDDIFEAAEDVFNIESPKQLAAVLFTKLRLPSIKKTKTGPSTDIEVLERLSEREDLTEQQSTVLNRLVEYRQLTKLVNTYLVNLKDEINANTGRVHAQFHQTGTATGRLSSSGPNLQNIPIRSDIGRRIRKAFVAADGCKLISADYSQIELRILAHLSGDPALLEAFEQGMDIHAAVASQVFGVEPDKVTHQQRTHAKTINFGIVYGVTPYGLARRIDGLDLAGARKLIADYKQRFTGIDKFLSKCVNEAIEKGHVTTMLGRRRHIREIDSHRPQTRALGERLAINSVVQGSAAELIKLAMVNLHRRIAREDLPLKMLLQIHDELVLESPADDADAMAEIVRDMMENAMSLKAPLKVDAAVGESWLEAK